MNRTPFLADLPNAQMQANEDSEGRSTIRFPPSCTLDQTGAKYPVKVAEEKMMQEKVMQGTINKYITAGSSKPKWRYRLRLGRDPVTGLYLREGKGGFAKEGEARAAMQERIAEIKKPLAAPPPSTEITVADWLMKWINVFAPRSCERKTLSRYGQLANYITADDSPLEMIALARTPLANVRRAQFRSALFALFSAKAKRRVWNGSAIPTWRFPRAGRVSRFGLVDQFPQTWRDRTSATAKCMEPPK
jgi:hypothetical protein